MGELAEIENIPKNLDFSSNVNSVNQVINHDLVNLYILQNFSGGIEKSMVVTGLQIQSKT